MDATLSSLLALLDWVETRDIGAHWETAWDALGAVDPKDVPYLAAALAIDADAIWSHDRDFDRQDTVLRVAHPALLR